MVETDSLSTSKSILAKLMATENLIVEEKRVRTASFDVQRRILTIPILDQKLSTYLYDLFTGHEVGHALWTPEAGMKKAMEMKIPHSVSNLVEDSRIERKIKNKYPGLKASFVKGYNELMERDFFGTKDIDLNQLNFLDRVNMHCKGGAGLNIQFSADERILLDAIESTETYDDVIEVSKRVTEYCKVENEKTKQLKTLQASEDGDDYDFDSEDPEYDELETTDDDGDSDEDEASGDDENEKEEGTSSGAGGGSEKEKTTGSTAGDEIRSFTDEAYQLNQQKLFQEGNFTYAYVNIPKVDVNKVIFDHKPLYKEHRAWVKEKTTEGYGSYEPDYENFIKTKNDLSKVVSYLVKEFEMRKNADQLKRASVAKTGELNMDKIFSYQFSEDIFKKISVVPGGKSHGLVMFLDWSGSMGNHISNTIKQLLALVLFCKKVNIPYEVYAFVSDPHYDHSYKPQAKSGDLFMHHFSLYNILSNRMSASEFTYACTVLSDFGNTGGRKMPEWFRLSGTPLNEAVIAAMEVVPHFQKKNKLQIVNTIFLTDGDGHMLRDVYGEDITNPHNVFQTTSFEYNANVVLRDPVTKAQEMFSMRDDYKSTKMTKALIKLLRERTGSNVIGFYVLLPREFSTVHRFYPMGVDITSIKEEFKKNKFTVVKNSGYDEYYLLKSDTSDGDEEFTVRENATTRGLVSAFSKYTNNRVSNRVVLNRFIGLIS